MFFNGWKQPVQNMEGYFKDDHVALLVWERLLIRARNSPEGVKFAGKLHFLKKGQAVFGYVELGTLLNRDRKNIKNAVKRLCKMYNKMDIKSTNKGTVATIKNYDEIVLMGLQKGLQKGQQKDNNGLSKGQQKDTNKNVENEKNEKNEKKNIPFSKPDGLPNINELIFLFHEINPSYKTLYANRTQRAALERLVREYGEDWIRGLLGRLYGIVSQPYAPRITTPLELEKKMGQLKIFLEQQKGGAGNELKRGIDAAAIIRNRRNLSRG